ncbi:MAG TPA: response regulator transcription factor [Anaerolineales bacterium]|nr:response regulator transcription factor [Anaerolineales bacterium]
MARKIRVVILDDHQGIIDGYLYRLERAPEVEVVGAALYAEDMERLLAKCQADVLLLDVNVPTSHDNPNPYPILHTIPQLLQTCPDLAVLVVSMYSERALVKAVMEAGASGYILKDDQAAIQNLPSILLTVAHGGVHYSYTIHQLLLKQRASEAEAMLTSRQLEALSVCAAYPGESTAALARRLGVANSTLRNLLSTAYFRLGVSHRTTAVAKARQLGLITSEAHRP